MLNGASEILEISYLVAATSAAVVSAAAAVVVAWLHTAATAIVAAGRT